MNSHDGIMDAPLSSLTQIMCMKILLGCVWKALNCSEDSCPKLCWGAERKRKRCFFFLKHYKKAECT